LQEVLAREEVDPLGTGSDGRREVEMESDRKLALAKGDKTFIGKPCRKDPEGHGDERYVSSGSCVVCSAERVYAGRANKPKKAMMGEAEVQALLLRGGPNSREQAEAAGLGWYNDPKGLEGSCHAIIGLNGTCPLCGTVQVKEELDLAAKLLS
jgi:hypothetical protein